MGLGTEGMGKADGRTEAGVFALLLSTVRVPILCLYVVYEEDV